MRNMKTKVDDIKVGFFRRLRVSTKICHQCNIERNIGLEGTTFEITLTYNNNYSIKRIDITSQTANFNNDLLPRTQYTSMRASDVLRI